MGRLFCRIKTSGLCRIVLLVSMAACCPNQHSGVQAVATLNLIRALGGG
ncbi:hypothetical protein PAMC26510_05660 [Caballeronia sordidicola]|uniref:Uncharacterized protein n=1 Tax=Caballeronia sordidicola TaxID=196367 RepID=A0A242M6Y1_CABSO|nr:hypothetical protein PAMC26577_38010 [Caballeronia sordidicola]OTP79676.1 hypothetical protein PAMC26510_05660 [Caballeronia sordidicola]